MGPPSPSGRGAPPAPRSAPRAHHPEGPLRVLTEERAQVRAALAAVDLTPRLLVQDSGSRLPLDGESVQLVVTSPPYPYIERWDRLFERAVSIPAGTLARDPGRLETLHGHLSRTWAECHRLLVPGGILAINIGDATRSVGGDFRLFPNHAHIVLACERLGFQSLVPILWKKPTNRPNSFLGSGFTPPNAYVTLDCEHILLFRKGGRRMLRPRDVLREASGFSREERDRWFSQVWDLRGAPQKDGRASFPLEVPRRLVRMFSVLGDTVLDPFAGSGATLKVAWEEGRRALGVEADPTLGTWPGSEGGGKAPDLDALLDRLVARYQSGR